MEHRDTLRNPKAVKSWFYSILVNEVLSILRNTKQDPPLKEQMTEKMTYVEPAYEQDQHAYELVTCLRRPREPLSSCAIMSR